MAIQQPPQTGLMRIVARVTTLIILSVGVTFPEGALSMDIFLGTGEAGTFSHFVGRAICRTIDRHADGLDCQLIPASDSIHNLTNLQGGSLDMALAESDMLYDAVNKKGYFEFLDIQYDNLGVLAPVYDQAILLVARADARIDSLEDLKGKRINAGPSRTRINQAVELILATKGWTHEDFKLVDALPASLSQDSMAFCHGSIQAMVHIGVHPDSALQKLIKLCNAVLVNIDDPDIVRLVDGHPAYSRMVIPVQTYPDFVRPVSTFGMTVWLLASGSLDDQTVQTIMAVLDEHREVLQHIHPAMGPFSLDRTASQDIGIALHPGAVEYLSHRQN